MARYDGKCSIWQKKCKDPKFQGLSADIGTQRAILMILVSFWRFPSVWPRRSYMRNCMFRWLDPFSREGSCSGPAFIPEISVCPILKTPLKTVKHDLNFKKCNMNPVLGIRIRIWSDPHHFAGSGSGSASRSCRSGSGRSRSILILFPENFNMLSKMVLKIIRGTLLPRMKKEKHCKTGIAVNESKVFPLFSNMGKICILVGIV